MFEQSTQPTKRSFSGISESSALENNPFYKKGHKPWSWTKFKRFYRRQPTAVRIAILVSVGFACYYFFSILTSGSNSSFTGGSSDGFHSRQRSKTRQRQAKKIQCDPRATSTIPLPPRVSSNGTHDFDPTVIVISYDGLRADYLNRGLTPNILDVAAKGVKADYMQPSFPTLTFPNHYTMCTGLYPASHGIVANMFYDPVLKDDFNYRIPDKSWDPKWWGGEPIWESAVLQNQRSGVIMWPGGESLRPVRPTYHVRHKSQTVALDKMKKLLEWVDKPRDLRPTLMMAYVSEVDTAGHFYGPDSKRCNAALTQVDTALGHLLEGLQARNLDKVVNIILVSDHGMAYVPSPFKTRTTPQTLRSIYYDDYIDTSELLLEESLLPHLAIRTKDPKKLDSIYRTLKEAQVKDKLPFQVFRREEIPERYNYRDNDRIAPVVVFAEPGYVMTRRDMGMEVVGVHGWDHEMEEMRAIFLASGPSFPKQSGTSDSGASFPSFDNVELYDIIARTIGLKVQDGSTDGVQQGWLARPC